MRRLVNTLSPNITVSEYKYKIQKDTNYVFKLKSHSVIDKCYKFRLFAGGHVLEDSIVLNNCSGILQLSNRSLTKLKSESEYIFELREFETHERSYSQYFDLAYQLEDSKVVIKGTNNTGMNIVMPSCWVLLYKKDKLVWSMTALFPMTIKPGEHGYTQVSVANRDFDKIELISYVII